MSNTPTDKWTLITIFDLNLHKVNFNIKTKNYKYINIDKKLQKLIGCITS